MKKFLVIFASAAFMLGLASCSSNTCHTCTTGSNSVQFCPDQNDPASSGVSDDQYMSAAETACTLGGGTWN